MSYIVFARKYRPKNFDEVMGQEHITKTLKNAIKHKRVAHAYLFSGPRGIGKTTTARIFAKALNCEKGPTATPCSKCISCKEIASGISMDVIEIDGASNRGIDEVRQLRENVKFSPAHGSYKLYIIDEVHMLTQEAFNALLKTLEEPPPHVKFIFATTQPNKVIATVASRCQRFDFRRISANDIVAKLKEIAKKESIKADEEALFHMARQAEGSLRDAESMLDQLNAFCDGKIGKDDIPRILGTVSEEMLEGFVEIIAKKDAPTALKFVDNLINEGKDLTFFLQNLVNHLRNLLVTKLCTKPEGLIDLAPKTIERIAAQAKDFSQEELFYISSVLVNTYESAKRSASARVIFELAIVKIAKRTSMASLGEVLDKIGEMEKRVKSNTPVIARSEATTQSRTSQIASPPSAARNDDSIKPQEPVATATAVATEAPAEIDLELAKIQELWPTLLKLIKTKKMSVASYLLEGELLKFEDNTLTIGFPANYSLHREALDRRENKTIIEDTIEELLKNKIGIKFIQDETRKEEPVPRYATSGSVREKEPIGPEVLKEPLVQSALEIFDGRVIRKGRS